MSAPAVPLTNTGPGYTIVTHVISPESATSQTGQNPPNNSPLQHFLKGEPKALGTFQQVIFLLGLITIIFGIILTFYLHSIVTIYNGSFYWASFLYITAGALAGSARFKFNKCKVTFSLVMNVLSAITAGLAVILLSVDFTLWWPECPNYGNHEYDSNYRCTYLGLSKGIRGVLLVCTIGHLIVSICISAYSCKVSCGNEPVLVIVAVGVFQWGTYRPCTFAPGECDCGCKPLEDTTQWLILYPNNLPPATNKSEKPTGVTVELNHI